MLIDQSPPAGCFSVSKGHNIKKFEGASLEAPVLGVQAHLPIMH